MSTATQGTIPEITLGWRLQMALGEMKVQDMADTLGVNRATVGRWMHDKGAPPKRAYILQWAMLTGTNAEWLETGRASDDFVPEGDGVTVSYPQLANVVQLLPAQAEAA